MDVNIAGGVWNRATLLTANTVYHENVLFKQANSTVALYAPPAILAAVKEYLHYETAENSSAAAWQIRCVMDGSFWFNHAEKHAEDWSSCLDYGDPGMVWEVPSGRLILDINTRSVIAVDKKQRQISVIAFNALGSFVFCYKSVRSLLAHKALENGGVSLHASAIKVNDKSIVFVGSKGSGKSTALLYGITSHIPKLSYLANDRIILFPAAGKCEALAWPTVAGFGNEALSKIKGIEGVINPSTHLEGSGLAYLVLNFPLIDRSLAQISKGSKTRLCPGDIRAAFKIDLAARAEVATIVLSSLNLESKETRFQEIQDENEKYELIRAHFDDIKVNHPDWLGLDDSTDRVSKKEAALKAVLADCRVVRADWGQDMKDAVRGICAFLDKPAPHPDLKYRGHSGVYGYVVQDGCLLAVKKARGPYQGWYDLPGGTPEVGESSDYTLERELVEEIGAKPTEFGEWQHIDVVISQDSTGKLINFRHFALVREVKLGEKINHNISMQDVAGAEWLPLADLRSRNDISAILRASLDVFPSAGRE